MQSLNRKLLIKNTTFPNREYIPALWIKAESAIEVFPSEYLWIVEPSHEKPNWVNDIKSLNTWYWSDIVKRINSIAYIYSRKLQDLFRALEYALPENAILLSALSLRSLIETVASLNWLFIFISKRFKEFDIEALNYESVIDEQLETELIRMTHGSRFNWKAYLSGDFDKLIKSPNEVSENWMQRNILGRINKLAKQKRYDSLRIIYDLLCEFAHPNFGSNLIYVRKEEMNEVGVRILLGSVQSRHDTIEFLEPLTGALLSCCQITDETLSNIISTVDDISKWCQNNYIYYVKKGKGL